MSSYLFQLVVVGLGFVGGPFGLPPSIVGCTTSFFKKFCGNFDNFSVPLPHNIRMIQCDQNVWFKITNSLPKITPYKTSGKFLKFWPLRLSFTKLFLTNPAMKFQYFELKNF